MQTKRILYLWFNNEHPDEIDNLKKELLSIKQPRIRLLPPEFSLEPPQKAMSIKKAGLSESEVIPTEQALGRICSKVVVACPPGVPVVVSGEIINENTIKILKKYSILTVNVVR